MDDIPWPHGRGASSPKSVSDPITASSPAAARLPDTTVDTPSANAEPLAPRLNPVIESRLTLGSAPGDEHLPPTSGIDPAPSRWAPPRGQVPARFPAPIDLVERTRQPTAPSLSDPWLSTGSDVDSWHAVTDIPRPARLVEWANRGRRPMWAWTARHWAVMAAAIVGIAVTVLLTAR